MEYSVVASLDDEVVHPTERLMDLCMEAIGHARKVDLSWLARRMSAPPFYPEVWPGEHYKLLAGFVLALRPRLVIEIGTAQGLGALALKSHLGPDSEAITLDLTPWDQFPDTVLVPADFEDKRLRQVLGDLSDREFFAQFTDTLRKCDLLFVDAPKDNLFERALLKNLSTISLPANAIVIFDDVRHWNMLSIWRELRKPKIDLTSFGHWTGTGVVDWNGEDSRPL
jgi:predicted O-methyltransferase YrrM